jgi:hypothetical protein
MTALTLRQVPPPVEKAIREEAAQRHISLNKAVVSMLEETVLGKKKPGIQRYHDLDWMSGTWSAKDTADFQKHLAESRSIDPELWQ